MPVGIEAWITQIPPITRGWLALSILISLAVVGLFGFLAFDVH
jgi:Derlin-2/3